MSSWIKSPVVIAALVLFVAGSAVAIVTGVSGGSGAGSKNKPAAAEVTSGDVVHGSGTQGLSLSFFAPMLTPGGKTARQGPADADSLRSGAVGAQANPAREGSYNGAPFTLTGPTVSKTQETISVTISSCGKVVRDLGYEPGDAVTILCSDDLQSSVKLAVGDWVEVMGVTIRGQLAASGLSKIPAHYGY